MRNLIKNSSVFFVYYFCDYVVTVLTSAPFANELKCPVLTSILHKIQSSMHTVGRFFSHQRDYLSIMDLDIATHK